MKYTSQNKNGSNVTLVHDADGNLTSDGVKQYQWDGENRLITVKQGTTTIAEYAYDYQSRRISKTVGSTVKSFVYDGWNPIAEYTATTQNLTFSIHNSFTWGMDLSGSMQGAGGVGGLLAVQEFNTQNSTSNTYFPTFDGNVNVSEYLDAFDRLPKGKRVGKIRPVHMYEVGGRVCCQQKNGVATGKFYYTSGYSGKKSGGVSSLGFKKCKDGDVPAGFYHNHPDGSDGLSGADEREAREQGVPIGAAYNIPNAGDLTDIYYLTRRGDKTDRFPK